MRADIFLNYKYIKEIKIEIISALRCSCCVCECVWARVIKSFVSKNALAFCYMIFTIYASCCLAKNWILCYLSNAK